MGLENLHGCSIKAISQMRMLEAFLIFFLLQLHLLCCKIASPPKPFAEPLQR
jgi:hypothetical protein